MELAALDGRAQHLSGPEEMILADDFVQRTWTHTIREGRLDRLVEKIH
jgi:hypothetical protein